ncbi:hypothetical protein [Acrocarpospora sp. B8E8]|uniref:hypothetical protein n=1 Tax=Acrocarpospora sp. B8E8 TaxID=3153572 RepID=UPI00325F29D3
MTGTHRGRSWSGHPLEDECPCPQEPCGLVDPGNAAPDCVQHGRNHPAKTMRQGHAADDCPGELDLSEMLRLVREALIRADARCPVHGVTPPPLEQRARHGDCVQCAQPRRVRRALIALQLTELPS